MLEPVAYGMHLPLALDEEFAKLPLRFEGFKHLHLLREAVFQVKNMLQVSIAGFPCLVQLAFRGVFLRENIIKKRDPAVEAPLSLF